jgi:hypothetical protein
MTDFDVGLMFQHIPVTKETPQNTAGKSSSIARNEHRAFRTLSSCDNHSATTLISGGRVERNEEKPVHWIWGGGIPKDREFQEICTAMERRRQG